MKLDFTETQLASILTSTATDMGPAGYDNTYGYGRLNVNAALTNVMNAYFALVPAGEYFGRICSNAPQDVLEYSINLPSGVTILWSTSPKLIIIGSNTSNIVQIKATTVNSTGVGTLTANISYPGCGTMINKVTMTLKNNCL